MEPYADTRGSPEGEDLVPYDYAVTRGSPEEGRSGPVCRHQRLSRRGKIWSRMPTPEVLQKRDHQRLSRRGKIWSRMQTPKVLQIRVHVTIFMLGSWFNGGVVWWIFSENQSEAPYTAKVLY